MVGRLNIFGPALAGAALMFLLDPQTGRRRRAILRDRAISAAHRTGDAVDVTSRDVTNRARGVVAELRGRLRNDIIGDAVLTERVRSRVGSVIGHAGAIDVGVDDGRVTLSGPVLASEVDRLVRRVRGVRGVRDVENRLTVHETPGDVPALQGRPRPPRGGEVFELLQTNWSPTARLCAGTVGGVLAIFGVKRSDLLGVMFGLVGLGLLYRAVSNLPLDVGAVEASRRVRRM